MATVWQCFRNDIRDVLSIDLDRIAQRLDGSAVSIFYRVYLDFESNSRFASCFVPSCSDSFELMSLAIAQAPNVLAEADAALEVSSNAPGEDPMLSKQLQFAGRLVIYAEDQLTEQQVQQLRAQAEQNRLVAQIRGPKYAEQKFDQKTRNLLAFHLLKGLCLGLSDFYRTSIGTALIYGEFESKPNELLVYDPLNILDKHKTEIWNHLNSGIIKSRNELAKEKVFPLIETPYISDGLAVLQVQSRGEPAFQLWLSETCETRSPAQLVFEWQRLAAALFENEAAKLSPLYFGTALRSLATGASSVVEQYLQKHWLNQPSSNAPKAIEPILEALLRVSMAIEEGQNAEGVILVCKESPNTKLEARLNQPVSVFKTKHIRKLLSPTSKKNCLVICDGEAKGYGDLAVAGQSFLLAEFSNGSGLLSLNEEAICLFGQNSYHAVPPISSLGGLESLEPVLLLAPQKRELLLANLAAIVLSAQKNKHGCTILLDFRDEIPYVLGQVLEPAITLTSNNDLVNGMSSVDGALHIDCKNGLIRAFACLLDGKSSEGKEERSRGARYNSAVRYTANVENWESIVVVVSEDGPVAIFLKGIQTNALSSHKFPATHEDKLQNTKVWHFG